MIPLLFLALASAAPAPPAAAADAPTPAMEKLLQDCDAHKFETVVEVTIDGKPHQSKVKLCGTKGQTDAAWVNTLKDAIAKVKANDQMSPEMRGQIVTALDAELARLGHADTLALVTSGSIMAKPATTPTLPPPRLSLPARTQIAQSARPLADDYTSLPPLPAPKLAASTGVIGSVLPSLPAPRMTIQCATTDDPDNFIRCGTLRFNSVLMVRADEPLPGGTSLRFMRRGDARGQVQLAQLRSGQSARVLLPHRVCDGVVHSAVEIEILRKPANRNAADQVVDTLGPYDLRC